MHTVEAPKIDEAAHRVVLVGYGPVGRTLSRILRDNGIQVVVVETNLETVPADTVMKAARELNPNIRILTRTTYFREASKLREAGANAVFSSEGEIALSMTEFVMRQIGATDEQIDRERDRVRTELFQSQHA
jgi:CPA2 family monovalent cation:H+ antiporter-2